MSVLFILLILLVFCQPCLGLRNCKSVFLILTITQYGRSRRWVQLCPKYVWKNWYKNWFLHFHETYDLQIWQAGTSREVHSNETNETGADDVIILISLDKFYTLYLHYESVLGHQTGQYGKLPWWVPFHKVTWPFDHVFIRNHVTH